MEAVTPQTSGIYRIQLGGGNFYIGSSANLSRRHKKHETSVRAGKHHNRRVQSSWNKYQVFEFVVLEECDKEVLIAREQFYFDKHVGDSKMNNLCLVAGSTLGHRHSEEMLSKISAAAKIRKISAETKAKMSESARLNQLQNKRVTSDEVKAKISKANTGYRHSEESKAMMAEKRRIRTAARQ
jgi:group I intron endonuclease